MSRLDQSSWIKSFLRNSNKKKSSHSPRNGSFLNRYNFIYSNLTPISRINQLHRHSVRRIFVWRVECLDAGGAKVFGERLGRRNLASGHFLPASVGVPLVYWRLSWIELSTSFISSSSGFNWMFPDFLSTFFCSPVCNGSQLGLEWVFLVFLTFFSIFFQNLLLDFFFPELLWSAFAVLILYLVFDLGLYRAVPSFSLSFWNF